MINMLARVVAAQGMEKLAKVMRHLNSMSEYSMSTKIFKAHTQGKIVKLTPRERNIYNIVRADIQGLTEISLLAHGARLRKELMYNPKGFIKRPKSKSGPLTSEERAQSGGALGRSYFSEQKRVPMTDIDFDSMSHMPGQVMFKNKQEAYDNLRDFLKTQHGRKHAFQVMDTPAGLRIFDVSRRSRGTQPMGYGDVWAELGNDPAYTMWSLGRKSGYSARLMPKPGRPGDFVAQPHPTINRKRRKISLSGFMKGKDATISRRSLKEIEDIHNAPIRFLLESLKREGKYPQQGLFSLTDLREHEKILRRVENLMK